MAPAARSKFGNPMFEPKVFRKQMNCIGESTCNIVGIFRRPPAVIQRPGNCGSPSLRPCGHPLAAFIDLVQAIKDNRRRWCEWRVGRRVGCSMYHTKRTCGQNVQLRSALFSSLFCFSTSLVLAAIDFVCVCRDSFASLILYEHVRDADEKLKKCFPLIWKRASAVFIFNTYPLQFSSRQLHKPLFMRYERAYVLSDFRITSHLVKVTESIENGLMACWFWVIRHWGLMNVV